MKEINLSKGQVALVDDSDYEWLNQWKWQARYDPCTGGFYAQRHILRPDGVETSIGMHRMIMNAKKGESVDHQNHKTLDNRRSNLRLTTSQGNCRNRRLVRNNTSGTCGVAWFKSHRKWGAYIQTDGKRRHLGFFVTKDAAIFARKAAGCQFGYHTNHGA